MQPSSCRVGIIGAGTSGVYLASLLARAGYQVSLFERAAQPRTDGCGILLIASGLDILKQGNPQLCEQLIAAGSPAKKFEFRNLKGGVANSETVTYEPDEIPSMLIHRKAILETLLADLPPNILHLNAKFEKVTQTETSAIAHFEDGSTWEGDVLIGSDGIFSKVRESVVPGISVSYLGDVVWRGVVPDDEFCTNGEFIVYMRGRGIYANFFDLGDGRSHWGFFIEKAQTNSEVGTSRPEDTAIPAAELAKLPEDARAIIEATPPEDIVTNFSYDIDQLPRLYDGKVLLIGDAAHAKSPSRARGMTSGFEDVLAVVKHLNEQPTIAAFLEAYQAERMPIVHKYQQSSREVSQKVGRSKTKAAT